MLMGARHDGDVDIATNATPRAIRSLFRRVVGVGEHFGVMLVVRRGVPYEVATFRSDGVSMDGRHPANVVFSDPQTDARRRDFTINGLFYDPIKKEIIDYVGGRDDLAAGVVRAVGNPDRRFKEDYLRVLRAIRFAARFSFVIEECTWRALVDATPGIEVISRERIFQELDKMLTGPNPKVAAELMLESGLMRMLLPEIQNLADVPQPKEFHPEGDVLLHTLKTLSFLESPSRVVAWSALLHDIGKPATISIEDRIRFNNHHRVGARMARKVLKRLKSPRWLTDSVCEVVENHMNFMHVTKMRLSTLKRFLSRPTLEHELELHRADCMASHGDLENYDFLKQKKRDLDMETIKPEPVLRGRDLIELGFNPGPVFGRILAKVYDLQLDERITRNQDAREWVTKNRGELLRACSNLRDRADPYR